MGHGLESHHGTKCFGGFIFAQIFSLAEPGDVAKRWHKNLGQKLLMILEFCFVTLKTSPDLLKYFLPKFFPLFLFLTEVYRTPRSNQHDLQTYPVTDSSDIFVTYFLFLTEVFRTSRSN